MSFLLYQKVFKEDKIFYLNSNSNYKLAGFGLIHSLWIKLGRPINSGWSITSEQILKEVNPEYSEVSHSLIIDYHPSSKEEIGLIEINKIHLYTYGENNKALWTPMMLLLNDVYYNDDIQEQNKDELINSFEPLINGKKIFEFLYLNGDNYSWNWGRSGMTNAAFIHEEARRYFSPFFQEGL